MFDPRAAERPCLRAALRDLIVQPAAPWFSDAERRHLEAALRGECAAASDRFWIARRGAELVASITVSTATSAPEIGLLGFAFTAPAHRGRGIGRLLVRAALADFTTRGGACLHLATGNPAAHRLYASCGFRDYNGHVMRFLARAADWEGFDRAYFAHCGPGTVRRGHWGDAARVAMLYVAPHPWLVRDYAERLINHPAIEQTRCGSILPGLLANTTARPGSGGLWVLENPVRRVVAAATLTPPERGMQAAAPVVDFLAAPAYLGQAPELMAAALDAGRSGGATRVTCCAAACDSEKVGVLLEAGFRREDGPAGALQVGGERIELHVYAHDLSG